jgi:hypothetical protein
VGRDVLTSGLLPVVLRSFLFLPLIGWRWSIGMLPLVIVFGASANDQVRRFGIYYSIYLVPFFVVAAAAAAVTIARRVVPPSKASALAAAIVAFGALSGGPGYALRAWRTEVAAVPESIALLANERIVLVQSGLYPHAGYQARVQLLTPLALIDPANAEAAILMTSERRIGAYPFPQGELGALMTRPAIGRMPGGLIAVRNVPQGSRSHTNGE